MEAVCQEHTAEAFTLRAQPTPLIFWPGVNIYLYFSYVTTTVPLKIHVSTGLATSFCSAIALCFRCIRHVHADRSFRCIIKGGLCHDQ
jgi:hypothetical protein